jgi:GrpB-like predicted nucleotidyltransferase (UPF0157 family)
VRIKVADSAKLAKLIQFLTIDADAYVTQISADEIEVGFVGSLNAGAQQMETELRLRAWLRANPDVVATLSE